ncbi:hypothetical protein AY601_4406 [Pedobacter cryoconitis]|uniref:Uncharacterized protein n=1 Tax=Pedobacter cryoconitis TaxID=188932 RepID=A0A127VK16_9SPHI|nr:hypothetical protein [Pedobacter cryoconitis]AMQ01249.1 hypothetical protein AY601_4406 [Pedobacter cryoconitis]
MIALITSTLRPTDKTHSFFKEEERYTQTLETIRKLSGKGFSEIYIFDNSSKKINGEQLIQDSGCKLFFIQNCQYTFRNKGLNEALLILNSLNHLPPDRPIFKISARYYPTDQFNTERMNLVTTDFIGKGYSFDKRGGLFSTRGYIVKDKELLERMLVLCIEDMMSYSKGIYGLSSLINHLKSIFVLQTGSPFQISMEHAFARILKTHFSYQLLENIGIEGYIAGAGQKELITE